MGCNHLQTEDLDRRIEANLRGENCRLDPDLEKELPEIRETLDKRYDQMMEEKNREFLEKTKDITPEEKEIMQEAVREAFSKLHPVETTPEERAAKRQAGQALGLSGARWFGSPDIARFPDKEAVKEVLAFLNDKRMPRCFTRFDVIPQVQYVGHTIFSPRGGLIGGSFQKYKDKDGTERALGMYIFADANGKCPSGELLRGRLVHEIVHANWERFQERISQNKADYDKALVSQWPEKGPPSVYSFSEQEPQSLEKGEWVAELYRDYLTDQEKLSQGMIDFFDKYFSPEAWEE